LLWFSMLPEGCFPLSKGAGAGFLFASGEIAVSIDGGVHSSERCVGADGGTAATAFSSAMGAREACPVHASAAGGGSPRAALVKSPSLIVMVAGARGK
jgi:hypothetical protein